jgi:microcystin-dependent protein
MPLKNGRTTASLQTIVVGNTIPSGLISPHSGGTVPQGWLLCNGQQVSRTTYANLFAAIGDAHGNGDGSTTFHLPDLRGQVPRGVVDITTMTGSGSASSNNATFTAHGVHRTGFKVRLQSGTLSGLATSTTYFVIVVDSNTLAFATTRANALAGTKIAISGTNTAVLVQYEDPDASSRQASAVGGNAAGVGARQDDAAQSHAHKFANNAALINNNFAAGSAAIAITGVAAGNNDFFPTQDINSGGPPRTSVETRSANVATLYIIKI